MTLFEVLLGTAQIDPRKTANFALIVFGTAPGLGGAAVPNEISGKAKDTRNNRRMAQMPDFMLWCWRLPPCGGKFELQAS